MKIRIIAGGIYGTDGELPIGSIHEISSPIPAGWLDRVVVIDELPVDAVPVTPSPRKGKH